MKQMWKEITIAAVLGLFLPSLLLSLAAGVPGENAEPVTSLSTTAAPEETAAAEQENAAMLIPVLEDGIWTEMELNDYLTGVVLAEMPASFETEAHKAQAVVARTYALKRCLSGEKHSGGGVCTDPSCCQGYVSEAEFLENGGTEEDIARVAAAVAATDKLVLTYDGELIEATYFSCSGGYTEDAVAVWGTDVPYLQATESPGEENAAHYTDTVFFTPEEFADALELDASGSPVRWLGEVRETAGGGVASMEICGVVYKGTTLRQLLGLRSTAFTMTAQDNGITITTRGYGHRVGMSQYGADAMAASGSSFEEILTHYYQGTELTEYIRETGS